MPASKNLPVELRVGSKEAAGRTIALKRGQIHQVLVFSSLFTVRLSLFYLGLSKSNASRGTLLANLLPFLILFLAHFFIHGDRITRRKLFGILLEYGVEKDAAFKNLKHIVESIQGQGARVIIGGLKFPMRDRGFALGY